MRYIFARMTISIASYKCIFYRLNIHIYFSIRLVTGPFYFKIAEVLQFASDVISLRIRKGGVTRSLGKTFFCLILGVGQSEEFGSSRTDAVFAFKKTLRLMPPKPEMGVSRSSSPNI
jgi:hypothetical protein